MNADLAEALGALEPWRKRIDERLEELLPRYDDHPLYEAMKYSALSPGKRARPLLCMASALAVGGDPYDAVDAGCAVEFLHAFSLIHDDLPAIDNDDLRRGRPTNHKVYGEAMAILAGDGLFALAGKVALQSHPDPAVAHKITQKLFTAALTLVDGEVLDIINEQSAPDIELVRTIHARKTGALLDATCTMGGLAGGGQGNDPHHLGTYGYALGMAFQFADDVLNETATAEQLGKSAGSDRELGKQTAVAALGLDAARTEAQEHAEQAMRILDQLPGDTAPLKALAHFVVHREN